MGNCMLVGIRMMVVGNRMLVRIRMWVVVGNRMLEGVEGRVEMVEGTVQVVAVDNHIFEHSVPTMCTLRFAWSQCRTTRTEAQCTSAYSMCGRSDALSHTHTCKYLFLTPTLRPFHPLGCTAFPTQTLLAGPDRCNSIRNRGYGSSRGVRLSGSKCHVRGQWIDWDCRGNSCRT